MIALQLIYVIYAYNTYASMNGKKELSGQHMIHVLSEKQFTYGCSIGGVGTTVTCTFFIPSALLQPPATPWDASLLPPGNY
jgi:hypothetical protein